MATPPAHHLSTARVPLYGNPAHGTPLDLLRVLGQAGVGGLAGQETQRAELEAAGGAGGGPGGAGADVADGLTVRGRTPGSPRVQAHLRLQPGLPVSLGQVGRDQPFHLRQGELGLPGTGRVRAGDAVAPGQDLQADVLSEAVLAELTLALGQRDHPLPGPLQHADHALLHPGLLVNPE